MRSLEETVMTDQKNALETARRLHQPFEFWPQDVGVVTADDLPELPALTRESFNNTVAEGWVPIGIYMPAFYSFEKGNAYAKLPRSGLVVEFERRVK